MHPVDQTAREVQKLERNNGHTISTRVRFGRFVCVHTFLKCFFV